MDSPSKKRRPVIVGVGQCVHRPTDVSEAKSPLEMIEEAIARAQEDTGLAQLATRIDALCLVNILSRSSEGLPEELSKRIGAAPASEEYTWIGACAPQWFVNRVARKIFEGKTRLALVCGGEAFRSRRLQAEATGSGRWDASVEPKESWMVGDLRDPITPVESKYGVILPIHLYPLLENGLRYHQGMSLEEHRRDLGGFLSKCSEIAAENSYAWFRRRRTAGEIVEVTDSNRMVAFPYTKLMCSIMEVDQSAALFLTNVQTARELGIPEEKWIYLLGSGDASDIWHVTERINFHSSPSVKVAAEKAMEQAGVSVEEIDYLDLYSCFPCAPRIARNMLGIPRDDPRPLTVTGGMPYFGGPGNNYALHAVCRTVEMLRQDPTKIGLVQALSWYVSKHSVGIYSGVPRRSEWSPVPTESYQAELDRLEGPGVIEEATGDAVVETYTVLFDRNGLPVKGIVIGRLNDGRRFLSHAEQDRRTLEAMQYQEFIGTRGRVKAKEGLNIFSPN
jgi:acetyl-CoA C-acetyltransferase